MSPHPQLAPERPEPYRPVPAEACDVGWKCPRNEPPMRYPAGNYCGHHARMMTPRVQREALGVPEPPPRAETGTQAVAGLEAEAG